MELKDFDVDGIVNFVYYHLNHNRFIQSLDLPIHGFLKNLYQL